MNPSPPSGKFANPGLVFAISPHGFRMWVSLDNPEYFFCQTAVSGRIPGSTTHRKPARQSPGRSTRSRKLQSFRSSSSWLTLYPPNCSSSKSTAYQVPFLRSRTYTAPESGSPGTSKNSRTDAGNSIQRTTSTFSATFISVAIAVCRSRPGSSCTTGSTIICPNIAVILSGQSAQVVLCRKQDGENDAHLQRQ